MVQIKNHVTEEILIRLIQINLKKLNLKEISQFNNISKRQAMQSESFLPISIWFVHY